MIVRRSSLAIFAALGLCLALALGSAGPGAAATHHAKNGKRIYFMRGMFSLSGQSAGVFSVAAHGGPAHRLTKKRASGVDGDPTVSPDGKTVAFDSNRSGVNFNSQIFKMKPNGKSQHAITPKSQNSFDPEFSPNGRTIAFVGARKGINGIYIMRSSGKHARLVTGLGPESFPVSWSPNGRLLAFASSHDGDFEIYTIHANGKHLKQLTHNTLFDSEPAFAPSGKKVLFSSSLTGNGDLYQMDLDGSHLKRLTKNPKDDEGPSYSPNGRSIVFTRGADLFTATRKGKHSHRVTTAPAGLSDLDPAWQPRP